MNAAPPFVRASFARVARLLACWRGALVFALLTSRAISAESDDLLEYRIKGAYLFNFTRFVDWPSETFSSPAAPIRIGILHAGDATAAAVVETIDGKTTSAGREIEVQPFTQLDPALAQCHVVFVTRSATVDLPALSELLGGYPVLLVGETDGFAARGGIINLVLAGSTVRCEINLKRAESAGLKLSGRLSSVARIVRDATRS